MINEAKKKSSDYCKPLMIHEISNYLKSKYYGESANNIKKVFDEIEKGDSLHLIIADDIDTILFKRDELEQSENIAVLGEFIKNLESIVSDNKGNYLLFATTNKPDSIDSALFRRFQRKINVYGPETIDDYVKLLKIKLDGYLKDGLIKVCDWKRIGLRLHENNLSGSTVADIAASLSDKILDTDLPLNLYTNDYKNVESELKNVYNIISEKEILEVIKKK
jgi:SpoVK/Ycf46/Vps4 family AAA+-type ATPase